MRALVFRVANFPGTALTCRPTGGSATGSATITASDNSCDFLGGTSGSVLGANIEGTTAVAATGPAEDCAARSAFENSCSGSAIVALAPRPAALPSTYVADIVLNASPEICSAIGTFIA